ncbi:MAG: TraB/GumN family protein [Candidatus Woesearchaeota archaeon]
MAIEYKNLSLIGTSHIARQSVEDVKKAIEAKPDLVAVELDNNRLKALNQKKSRVRPGDIFRIGVAGFLFALIGAWAQKKLGGIVGVEPGTEMLTAVRLARKNRIPLEMIDRDITITLARLSRNITWKEKLRVPFDIIKSILFRKRELERLGIKSLDLTKVPPRKIIKALTKELKDKFPNVHKVLVEERNEHMARRLSGLMDSHPGQRIVAVVGAGHEEDILGMVKKLDESKEISYQLTIGPQ